MNRGLLVLLRTLLIAQAVGASIALVALSVLLFVEVLFAAFPLALFVFLAWIALLAAIIAAFFGQWHIGRGDRRWWWSMMGLETLVVLVGIALLAYLLLPTRSGVPPPPASNVVLVLVLPVLAMVILGLLVAGWPSRSRPSAINESFGAQHK